jgi:hypothetical protein
VQSSQLVRSSATVYNIEVHGEHVYQVGELGLLVHNACGTDVLQTGGRTILESTARALNEYHEMSLHRRDWGRLLEKMKHFENIRGDHHGQILRNANYLDMDGTILGNLLDWI